MSATSVTFRGASWFPIRHFAATVVGTYIWSAIFLAFTGISSQDAKGGFWNIILLILTPLFVSVPIAVLLAAPSYGMWKLMQRLKFSRSWHYTVAGALLPLLIWLFMISVEVVIGYLSQPETSAEDFSPFANSKLEFAFVVLLLLEFMIAGAFGGTVFYFLGRKGKHA